MFLVILGYYEVLNTKIKNGDSIYQVMYHS